MRIFLAPMEGLVDAPMRDVLTATGGIDGCVTEFIRVTNTLLPRKVFERIAPELEQGWRTPAGTPIAVQFLGSDPACIADNAARAVELGAPSVDINFGCPAKTVNRHGGGAALLREPETLRRILGEVRRTVPSGTPVSGKMRLGYEDKSLAMDCAAALVDGGAAWITVHARTKVEGYRPPAHWEWIARIRETCPVNVIANGDIWTVEDYQRCREVSGCADVMIGRGLITRPDLARQIRAWQMGEEPVTTPWADWLPVIERFCARTIDETPTPRHASGRIKQWFTYLRAAYTEAGELFEQLKRENDPEALMAQLQALQAGEA